MAYRIGSEAEAEKQLYHLDARTRERVLQALARLAEDPFKAPNVKALKGREGYRLRVGECRVLCTLRQQLLLVVVIKIGHRREVYRRR